MTAPKDTPALANFYVAVWDVVRLIPRGHVATYGQIATLLGSPRAARAVGYALLHLREQPGKPQVPWHRVLNAQGAISEGGALHRPALQRRLLEAEGLRFDVTGKLCLKMYRWRDTDIDIDIDACRGRAIRRYL